MRTDRHGEANERILQLVIHNAPREAKHEFPVVVSNPFSLSTGDVTYRGLQMRGRVITRHSLTETPYDRTCT